MPQVCICGFTLREKRLSTYMHRGEGTHLLYKDIPNDVCRCLPSGRWSLISSSSSQNGGLLRFSDLLLKIEQFRVETWQHNLSQVTRVNINSDLGVTECVPDRE